MPSISVRRASAASRRFQAAPRSKPVAWLVGGIGGCFALALAFVLLGGSPPIDTVPDAVAALEAKARQAEDAGRLEEAIALFQQLLKLVEGREDYRISSIEWRRVIKDLQAEAVDMKTLDAEFAALEREAKACKPEEVRAVWEKVKRFQVRVERLKRPWSPRLVQVEAELRDRLPKPPPSWAEWGKKVVEECKLERRGEAQWGLALRRWDEYLALKLDAGDLRGGEGARRNVEQRAREEVASLKGRKTSIDDLRRQRPRFEGTAALAELDRAIDGR